MVSSTKVLNNGGDKSPSPEPFKEPEGLVTIELPNSKKNDGLKKIAKQVDQRRKLILEIILALFLFNVTVFGVLLYFNEDQYIFKAKPQDNQNLPPQNRINIEELIKKCVLTKPLKVCCNLFGEANEQFDKFCFENLLKKSIKMKVKNKRDITHKTAKKTNPSYISPPIYYDDNIEDYGFYEDNFYDYRFPIPNNEYDYNFDGYNNLETPVINSRISDIGSKNNIAYKSREQKLGVLNNENSNQPTKLINLQNLDNIPNPDEQKLASTRIDNNEDILSINIPLDTTDLSNTDSEQLSNNGNKINNPSEPSKTELNNSKERSNIYNSRIRQNNDLPTMELQSSQQSIINPCLNFPNQYVRVSAPFDNNQFLKIVPSNPKVSHFFINPPMYPYMQQPFMNPQQFVNQQISNNPVQVTGPGGQYYICNPISTPTNNGMSNNIANIPGVEVRRNSANLQDSLVSLKHDIKISDKSRAANILCPMGYKVCSDGSKCIPKFQVCDNEVQCNDGSDEEGCTCKDRIGKLRTCDGYFDCPLGEDEQGCFGCEINEFSCDDWSKSRKSTCIPIEQRCDKIRQCEITGKDEEDCSVLTDNIGEQPFNKISNSVGFLHRNYKGTWYPTCFGTDNWALDVCKIESGPTTIFPKTHMMLSPNNYDGDFINILPDEDVSLVKTCVQDRATYIECPPIYCGMRISVKNPYRQNEVDISAENIINDLEREANEQKDEEIINNENVGNSRVVGGKPSQPAAWPWLVSIYRNGIFHCGGVLISELWIITASHCIDRYWQYYYEIQAGMLRRFSYSPMEQRRWASVVIGHDRYDKMTLKNDIALMKLSMPVRFNRYVRPICLPSDSTAGIGFSAGPIPGTICTTVGWGATIEHGSDPDHMREVEVPILERCRHKDDLGDEEICAGLSEGGKDACQGDSGGPLMCRNPSNPSQWYLAGIVSHGEGCARPDEPGVYTKVAKYVGWTFDHMAESRFIPRFPLKHCPGYICKITNKCIPKKHQCDKIVDCLLGDDELNCKSFLNLFSKQNENDEDSDSTLGATLIHSKNIRTDFVIENNSSIQSNKSLLKDDYFKCKSILQLIPSTKRCNKIVDCEDGTDEVECQCADYVKNQNPSAICDGITDCYDLTDEKCDKCKVNEYHCRQNQKCIELSKRCDGISDCEKSEDEWDCVALTNGKILIFDSDLRPNFSMAGIITINKNGIWRPLCQNNTNTTNTTLNENAATIVTNVCYMLGFEEYEGYHEYQVQDFPLNTNEKNLTNSANKICNGLFVKCSNVSLDSSIHDVNLDNVTDEVELYTSPWNAVIYVDGIYSCMGTILNSHWIVTSVNCSKGITILNYNYIAVLLGKGKATLEVKGPHEQTLRIVETVRVSDTDILLLRTEHSIMFSRYIKHIKLNIRRDGRRREKCVAIGLHKNKAKYEFLSPIENCIPGFRCFETKIKSNCTDSSPWSGNIVCDSGNGWYPAAVFFEERGLCGLSSVLQYTSLPFNKNQIIKTMEQPSLDNDAPTCNGFRCALGECINKTKTCNGIAECRDGEDEEPSLCYERERLCHLTEECACQPTELKCKNRRCIPKSKFCDKIDDCGDSSDEPPICNCKSYLDLTNPKKNCDGIVHCLDRSDENPQICPCPSNGFQCLSTTDCVANDMVCDGFEDCPNGEDEKVCFNIVTENNETTNAGELVKNTGGVWHSGCFNMTYTKTDLNKICFDLGFDGDVSHQLLPPKNHSINTMRSVIDNFDVVWIRWEGRSKFRLGIRTGNEPYVSFVADENCFKLFLACL